MFNEFIQKHQSNAILAALVASVLALGGTVLSNYLTYYYNVQSQDRQVKLEKVSRFDASSAELIAAAGVFINAINDSKDLEAARKQLSSVVASQIYNSQDLGAVYGNDVGGTIREYQTALTELNQTSQKTSSATEMRAWSETFGRVLDTKAVLSEQLYGALGSGRRS
jgi:hypothetical protein